MLTSAGGARLILSDVTVCLKMSHTLSGIYTCRTSRPQVDPHGATVYRDVMAASFFLPAGCENWREIKRISRGRCDAKLCSLFTLLTYNYS